MSFLKDGFSQCSGGQEDTLWQLIETNLQYKTELTEEENSVFEPLHKSQEKVNRSKEKFGSSNHPSIYWCEEESNWIRKKYHRHKGKDP